jgi:hypothetical protein
MSRSRILNARSSLADSEKRLTISLLSPGNVLESKEVAFTFETNTLTEHVIVTGAQSELSTEFCKKLVSAVAKTRVPFLVLTSNRAYRTLLERTEGLSEIVYYTLGQNLFPVAVNLFELLPEITVASHINRLGTIFRKIFNLSQPTTYALEKIFTAVYERRGWNLLDNSNSRISEEQSRAYEGDLYPVLSESLEVIDDTVESCLLDAGVKTEIKSNLQSILSSLTSGVNRSVFNTRSKSSVVDLFQQRVIIETTTIRADQDRALYASILLNFYEEIIEPSADLKNVFVLDDCSQMSALFAKPDDGDDSKAPSRISFDLDRLTASGQCVVFCGIRGTQFEPINLSQTGLCVIFQERNTRAMSMLGGFLSLNLSSLGVIKALAPYEVLTLQNCDNSNEVNLQINQVSRDKTVAVADANRSGEETLEPKCHLFALEHTLLRAQAEAISDEQLEELNHKVERANGPLAQKGASYFPEAFTVDSLAIVEKLLQNKSFYAVFVRYIASFTKDLTQLVHFRAQLIHEVQRLTGRKTPEFLRKISWCSISHASERYFGAKALINHWSLADERSILHGWFELMAPAFVPDVVNPTLQRRLDISQVRGWRDQFLELQTVEQGPFPACGTCTSKCLLGYDVSQFLSEQGLFFDFNSAISRRDAAASDSSAWYVRLLCERLIGQFDLDLSYCLAIHFIKTQQLSTDAQLVLLQKVRQHLQMVGQPTDTNQIDRGKRGDEVRVIQFPKMMKD